MPKVSIIIPIYNVENFLHQTLFSVVNQTLYDIEIICVEDCSTDSSLEIVEKFFETDKRIHLVRHTCNQGVSICRKEAILKSTGEYIMFLDGDDYLDSRACKKAYSLIQKEKVDMLQFGTIVIPRKNIQTSELSAVEQILKPYDKKLVANDTGEMVNFCFKDKKYGFTLWNKIYKGDIVRKAMSYYPDERFNLAEDMLAFFLIAFFSKTYAATEEKYYFYNFGAGITGGLIFSEKIFQDKIKQGKIVSYLKTFVQTFDPIGITDEAVEAIQKQFVSDVVYNLIWHREKLNNNKLLNVMFDNFDTAEVLSELLNYYYTSNYDNKKRIIGLLKDQDIFISTKKKIKTVGTFYFRIENGGVERVLSELMSIWLDAGYQVVLFTDEIPSPIDYDYPDNIVRIILPKIRTRNVSEYKKRISFFQEMMKKYEVDIMVYHAWISEFLFLDILAIKSTGVPFVVHTHSFFAQGLGSSWAEDAFQTLMINDIYKYCDAIITLSEVDYSWWALRFDNVYKVVNPLGMNWEDIQPAKLDNNNILWIGRISPEKKPIDALKILKEVLNLGCEAKLQVVGKSDNKEYQQLFEQKIKDFGLEKYVVLHGYQRNVKKYYMNAAVYLHTSDFEGFSMTIVESKIYGLPAIIYDLPNLDIVKEGEGMQIVRQGDVIQAAQKIKYLLENPQKRIILGVEAKESLNGIYSLNFSDCWENIFENILKKEKMKNKYFIDREKLQVAVGMMLDFSAKGVEAREFERQYIIQNSNNGIAALESEKLLEEIYNMRSWKLIEKYRYFMDNTKVGKILSKVRDSLLKK